MDSSDLVLVQGLRDTRGTFARWREHPWPILARWTAGAFAVAVLLLVAVWVVAKLSTPDPSVFIMPGLNVPPTPEAVRTVLERNALVLALHAFACIAGFIAGSSLPQEAERHSGLWRWVHDRAGPLAIGFVSLATTFSLATQAYVIGGNTATLAAQLHISPAHLLLTLLPHAVPELVALFLPLAAWLIASRRGEWHELLAATFVTVGIAVPVLLASSVVEVYVTPRLVARAAGYAPGHVPHPTILLEVSPGPKEH